METCLGETGVTQQDTIKSLKESGKFWGQNSFPRAQLLPIASSQSDALILGTAIKGIFHMAAQTPQNVELSLIYFI